MKTRLVSIAMFFLWVFGFSFIANANQTVSFTTPKFQVKEGENQFQKIVIEDYYSYPKAGYPDLPIKS